MKGEGDIILLFSELQSSNGSQLGAKGLNYSLVCVTSSESHRENRHVNKYTAVCTDQISCVTLGKSKCI